LTGLSPSAARSICRIDLHARHDHVVRAAYPRFDEFVEQKKKYDPGLLFRNLMWERLCRCVGRPGRNATFQRAVAVALGIALAIATLSGLIPGLADASGRTFGLFRLKRLSEPAAYGFRVVGILSGLYLAIGRDILPTSVRRLVLSGRVDGACHRLGLSRSRACSCGASSTCRSGSSSSQAAASGIGRRCCADGFMSTESPNGTPVLAE